MKRQHDTEGDDEGQLHKEEGFEHIARMFAFCGKVDLQGPWSNLHARQSFSGGIDDGVVRIRCLSRPLARSLGLVCMTDLLTAPYLLSLFDLFRLSP